MSLEMLEFGGWLWRGSRCRRRGDDVVWEIKYDSSRWGWLIFI